MSSTVRISTGEDKLIQVQDQAEMILELTAENRFLKAEIQRMQTGGTRKVTAADLEGKFVEKDL